MDLAPDGSYGTVSGVPCERFDDEAGYRVPVLWQDGTESYVVSPLDIIELVEPMETTMQYTNIGEYEGWNIMYSDMANSNERFIACAKGKVFYSSTEDGVKQQVDRYEKLTNAFIDGFDQGIEDYMNKRGVINCPYQEETAEAESWWNGHKEGFYS